MVIFTAQQLRTLTPLQRQQIERYAVPVQAVPDYQAEVQKAQAEAQRAVIEQKGAEEAYNREMAAYRAAVDIATGRSRFGPGTPPGTYRYLAAMGATSAGGVEFTTAQMQQASVIQSLKEQGLTPIFRGGQLVGAESPKLQMSFPISELMKQPVAPTPKAPSIQEQFYEKLGLVKIQTPFGETYVQAPAKVPSIQKQLFPSPPPEQVKALEALGFVRKTTPFGVTYEPKEGIPEKLTWKEKLAEKYPSYRYIREKALTAEEWLQKKFPPGGRPLPYGLEIKEEEKYGYKFSPWYAHMYLGRKLDPYVEYLVERAPFSEQFKKELLQPVPSWVVATLAEAPKIYFFSQFLDVGATKKLKQKAKLKQKLSKKELNELAKVTERNIREAHLRGRVQLIRDSYKKALQTGDTKVIKDVETILKNSLGSKNAAEIIKDVRAQELPGLIVSKPRIEIELPEYVSMEKLPEVITGIYAGKGLYERTWTPEEQFLRAKRKTLEEYGKIEEISIPKQFRGFAGAETGFESLKPTDNLFVSAKIEGKFKDLGIAVSPRIKTAETERIKQLELLKIQEKIIEKQRPKIKDLLWIGSISMPALGQPTAQIPRLAQRPKLAQPLVPKYPQPQVPKIPKPKIPKPKIPIPIPPLFFLPLKIKRKKRIMLRKRDIFIPEVRRRGKWRPLGAFRDPFAAVAVGKRRVMETLGVSLRIRKAEGGLLPLAPSKFFRAAKKEVGVIVQKKYRIGAYTGRITTPGEKAEIKKARRKKKGWWI